MARTPSRPLACPASSASTRRPAFLLALAVTTLAAGAKTPPAPQAVSNEPAAAPDAATSDAPTRGANETTPSRAHYFDWINSQYEGTTEAHTLTNLAFFQYLHDAFGLNLDIYSLDVGNIDDGPYTAGVGRLSPAHYGSLQSAEFRTQFPHGFTPLVEKAAAFGCRLGIWLGPDGFGNAPAQTRQRTDLLVSLCRDFNFALFKLDAVAGNLRPDKQATLMNALQTCRTYTPDLVVLNERVDLGAAEPYATTSLWEGAETYTDVFSYNTCTAPHHRAGALARGYTPNLTRLMEDHGVCLSSCLDYWDDELVIQAFARNLILAPQIYGNPWLLRDDELPRLARLFNLHRQYRDILVSALPLPEDRYGPLAISRGNGQTRLITMRNLTWQPQRRNVKLDESLGLTGPGPFEVRLLHPFERVLGLFDRGAEVPVTAMPFRACLLIAADSPIVSVGVTGCAYSVVRDLPNQPVVISLLNMPGTKTDVRLMLTPRRFSTATLDGQPVNEITRGVAIPVSFGGDRLTASWRRHLGALTPCPVPADAAALYEATCFAADSNALEVRSLHRSGPTALPPVQAARDAFFSQRMFTNRGLWDRNLFDGDLQTHFVARLPDRVLRVDFGQPSTIDRIVLRMRDREDADLNPALHAFAADAVAEVSPDLRTWTALPPAWTGHGTIAELTVPTTQPIRYLRITGAPQRIAELEAYRGSKPLDRTDWRASNLLPAYAQHPARAAWSLSFVADGLTKNSVLAVPIAGRHGVEGAYAALRIGDQLYGAPDRAVSYPSNTWEYQNVESDSNYTYYFPLTPDLAGQTIEVIVLLLDETATDVTPEAWLTAYPIPFESHTLVLTD